MTYGRNTVFDSQLVHAIAQDQNLMIRIEGVIRRRLASHAVSDVEKFMLQSVPYDLIAWAVASNPTVFDLVRQSHKDGASVSDSVQEGLTDADLEYVVYSQLTCLQ